MSQKLVQRQCSFLRCCCSIQCIVRSVIIPVVILQYYWSSKCTTTTSTSTTTPTTLIMAFTTTTKTTTTNNRYSKRTCQLYNPLCSFQSYTASNNQQKSFYHIRNNKVILTKTIQQQQKQRQQQSSSSSSLGMTFFESTSTIPTEPTIATTTTFQLLANAAIVGNSDFISNIVFTLVVVIVPLILLVISTSTSYTSIMVSSTNLTKEIQSNENEMKLLKEKILQSNQSKNNSFVVAILSLLVAFSIGVLGVVRTSVDTTAVSSSLSSLPEVSTTTVPSRSTTATIVTTNQISIPEIIKFYNDNELVNVKVPQPVIEQPKNLLVQQQSQQQSTAATTTTLSTTTPIVEAPIQTDVIDSSIELIPKLVLPPPPVQVLPTKKQEQEQLSSSDIQSKFFQSEVTSLNNLLQKVGSVKTIATDTNLLKQQQQQQQNELITTTPDAKLVVSVTASTTIPKLSSSKILSMTQQQQQSDSLLTSEITSLNRLQQKLDTVRIVERPLMTKASTTKSSIPSAGAASSSSSSPPTINVSPSSSSVSTIAQIESLQSELPSLNKLFQKVNNVRINEIRLPTNNNEIAATTTTADTMPVLSSPVSVQSVSVADTATIKEENVIDSAAVQEKLKQLRILKTRLLELQRKLEVLSTESSKT